MAHRPARQGRRAGPARSEAGHPDDGRHRVARRDAVRLRARARRHRCALHAVGLARSARGSRYRSRRSGRRLDQGEPATQPRAQQACQGRPATGRGDRLRARCHVLGRHQPRHVVHPLRRPALRAARRLVRRVVRDRDRRRLERREPDRRSRRAGGRFVGFRLQLLVDRRLLAIPPSRDLSRGARRSTSRWWRCRCVEPAWGSSGGTPLRPGSSWATRAPLPSARALPVLVCR